MLGGILAMLIIILFLRNVRGTLIIVVAIPLSILITFILFRFGGITLNIMTFGGLALAVGRLVDDSIVELEAISRHYNMRKKGQSKLDATLDAAREVASPIFVSTLTNRHRLFTCCLFKRHCEIVVHTADYYYRSGFIRIVFCFPDSDAAHVSELSAPGKELDRTSMKFSDRMRVLFTIFWNGSRILTNACSGGQCATGSFIVISILLFALLSFGLIFFIGTEFFPDQDESRFTINYKLPVGSRYEGTDTVAPVWKKSFFLLFRKHR